MISGGCLKVLMKFMCVIRVHSYFVQLNPFLRSVTKEAQELVCLLHVDQEFSKNVTLALCHVRFLHTVFLKLDSSISVGIVSYRSK